MSGRRTTQKLSRLQVTVLLLTAAGAILASLASSRLTDGRAELFFMEHLAGDVLFDHAAHVGRSVDCASCHHTLWESATQDPCETCHGDDVDAEFFEHIDLVEFHDSDCGTCHEQANDEKAKSCRECHPAAQLETQATRVCEDCHEFDRDEASLGHADLIELHRECEVCHAPRAVGAAYHDQCAACHLAVDPERFGNEDGTAACGWCHLQ